MKKTKKEPQQEKFLTQGDLDPDPIRELQRWLKAAETAKIPEPTAMVLATSTPDGEPSARMVLLKSVNDDGLVFFTNYESRKGKELRQNPKAALLFYWDLLLRQVRVEGRVSVLSEAESFEYFKTRPLMSRIGAWASKQSEVLSDREVLEKEVERLEKKFAGKEIPLPPFWGGFRLIPSVFEFWQGRENRLHDRFRYSQQKGGWAIDRLSP
jgi:pyridoxamine 5'-phosphate oxidase